MLATWLGTLFSEAVTSYFFCGWVTTADQAFLFPAFSYSCRPASTFCLVVPPILPAWLLANQHFIKIQLIGTNHCPTAHGGCKALHFRDNLHGRVGLPGIPDPSTCTFPGLEPLRVFSFFKDHLEYKAALSSLEVI